MVALRTILVVSIAVSIRVSPLCGIYWEGIGIVTVSVAVTVPPFCWVVGESIGVGAVGIIAVAIVV